jgi:hypothetical protein
LVVGFVATLQPYEDFLAQSGLGYVMENFESREMGLIRAKIACRKFDKYDVISGSCKKYLE